jgi:fibronectin-binding autotransporter adhesin
MRRESHVGFVSRLALCVPLVCLSLNSLSAATTNRWTNAVSSVWNAATNWSAGVLPSSSFDFTVISNAATKTVTIDAGTPVANLAVRGLMISAPVGSTNTLQLIDLPAPMTSSGVVNIQRGGMLEISNSTFTAQNTFDVTSGSLVMDSGLLDTSGSQVDIRVGRASCATATVKLKGGTIKCFGFRLGELNGSNGACTNQGGTLWSTSVFDVGELVNSPGSFTMTSGQIIATNDVSRVGNLGSGQFNQSGGTSSFSFWSIADNAQGTANISGGLVTITPGDLLDVTRVGNFGTGHLNISGGTVWARGEFHVADNPGVQGSVLMTGGTLLATNGLVAIGRYGFGDTTVTNATAYFTNTSVGRHTDATGTLNVQNSGSIFCVDDLSIGRFTNSIGTVNVAGGLLSLTNDSIWVGREGNGTLTVLAGSVKAKAIYSGMSEDGTNSPSGTMTISGGSILLSSNLMVGTSMLSTGQVNFVGGLLAVTNANGSGAVNVVNGTAVLNGGTLVTDQLILTNAEGTFSFASGTLQAKNMTVTNGTAFVVGDGIQPATLQLQGGTCSFADGLVISSNATVLGCGTILGTISNNGTLSTNCNSTPVVLIGAISRQGSVVTVNFSSLSGASHSLEFKNSLNDPVWNAILPPIVGNGGVTNALDLNATNKTRFYRIHVQ